MRVAASLAFSLVLSLGSVACGGNAPPPSEPAPSTNADASDTSEVEEEEEDAAPARLNCDDGTCFDCGAGICPSGAYCDDTNGGACAWLPECTGKVTCACLGKVLGASCTCSDENGGPHVSCGS